MLFIEVPGSRFYALCPQLLNFAQLKLTTKWATTIATVQSIEWSPITFLSFRELAAHVDKEGEPQVLFEPLVIEGGVSIFT
jgi:hypothetical protein